MAVFRMMASNPMKELMPMNRNRPTAKQRPVQSEAGDVLAVEVGDAGEDADLPAMRLRLRLSKSPSQ